MCQDDYKVLVFSLLVIIKMKKERLKRSLI